MSKAKQKRKWKKVPNQPGLYASNDGLIRGNGLKQTKGRVQFQVSGKPARMTVRANKKNLIVHRLILAAFVGPAPKKYVGCHNNGNPLDNRIENLRWDTQKENIQDRTKHGRTKMPAPRYGRDHHNAKLSRAIVATIRKKEKSWRVYRELAAKYGVSDVTIYKARIRETWPESEI